MDWATAESIPVADRNGWINEQLFTSWFEHFLKLAELDKFNTLTTLLILIRYFYLLLKIQNR